MAVAGGRMRPRRWWRTEWPLLVLLVLGCDAEHVRDLEVSEGAPVGTRVGFIGDGSSSDSGPPYLIVPVPGSAVDTELSIEQNTGEIRTKVPLDRETRASYSLVAIPLSGENVRVVVRVLDENDNAPTFPSPVMSIEFPENTPRDVKRTLNPARDLDLGIYNTQRYNIVSGNVNNAFRLSSHRERDGVLYLDLQINGFLDRETTAGYSLVIEALDGGSPPLKGQMTVNITIQDVNDNQPIFNQSRYFATVPENATVGTSILQVHATDADASENGEVEYSINRRQSDREGMFKIDSKTGMVTVNKPLDFETKEVHELVVVAKDHGVQPLETTAFVSIRVTDVNDNQPTINVIFLSDDATPKISEMAQPGEFVARISVNDPDSKTEYSNVNVTLEGGEGHFGLATQDNIIYLVIVSLPIDREQRPNYTLSVIATDTGTPPLHASRTFHLRVTDINDNAPQFEEAVYYANVLEVADPGTSVFQIKAVDIDEGENSVLTYSIQENTEVHSSWFQIDPRSGLITTKSHIDCETDPVPQLTVVATDSGDPPLSSSATVLVTIHDVNDNEPIFDQTFYNITLPENESKGHCVLKISATDPDCGVNAMVNYTLAEGYARSALFEVKSVSGEVCIFGDLDYETRSAFEFPVIATDRGGLSTTAMVKIQLTDVNDNWPTFYPREYNVSLRSGTSPSGSVAVVVSATDRDSGRFGAVTYQIVSGNEGNLFRIDRVTGEVYINQPSLSARVYRLNVSATDGAGLRAREDAEVLVTVSEKGPFFERTRYNFNVREDVPRNTMVGAVKVVTEGYRSLVKYSIVDGDADGYFSIDPGSGAIRTSSPLDHEAHTFVLITVQAATEQSPAAYTQVKIVIDDVNDNGPEFDSTTVRLSVPENAQVGVPLYAAQARDSDSSRNGLVRYRLVSASSGDARLFAIEPRLGHLTLARQLDYETAQRHSLVVSATDAGEPPLTANLTVLLEVQDVNDNPPVFERTEYVVTVSESLPVNSQVVQVTAVDLDTGNNARLTYRLLDTNHAFGIFPNSGWLYLRHPLDREVKDRYSLRVAATDNGTPAGTATAVVVVSVSDANDNDPAFAQDAYQFGVEENLPRGAPVGVIRASDRDLGTNGAIRFSLIPSNSSFQINPVTGEIFTREPLDRETKSEYELVAEARDQGTPPRSARVAVRVTVTDVNDNAPDIVDPQEDVISVREEQPPGTEVVRVRAVDRDQGYNASVTYSIVKGGDTDGHGVFTVDQVSGLIRTRTVLDHEERAIYRLAVAARDSGSPPKETVRVLRVEVLDLNDNRPTFTSSSLVFKIREDVPVGYVVGNVVTSDSSDGDNLVSGRAGGGHVMYTLTSMSPPDSDGAFDMDRSTGSLVVARQLDREKQPEYKLEVRALDTSTSNNPQSSAVVVRVELSDINDNAPKWEKDLMTIEVAENAAVGSAVWNFSASDADAGFNGELRYSLVDVWPQTSEPQFSVDALTGTLTLMAPLDFELIEVFTLVVRVTDQASNVSDRLSSSLTVRIVIKDVNDNAPVFVSPATKTVTVMEDSKVGYSLCQITAVDKDSGENARITYTISAGNEDGKFTLGYNTGVLTLARSLDVSSANGLLPKYHLNITASDHGSPTAKKNTLSLTLLVHGSTETPPKFISATYHAHIPEDAAIGSVVIKVAAGTGQESGTKSGNLSFHMPRGVADNRFSVDPQRGTVTLAAPLDRETRDHYVFPVYVMDKLYYDVATISIRVTDVNDHAPEFRPGACYPLSVPENSDLAVVHTLTATDADAGANGEITYSITAGNIGNKFSIDLHTGELSARPLDRESQPRYQLVITAQDRGSPSPLSGSCNITVTVEDQNDNDPRFSKLRYTATIPEDIEVGSTVLTVKAADADLGVNAKLVYSLANESQWLFHIDNRTGVITTAGVFDRERQSVYEFQVVATDGGRYDARSQKVPVQITIGDVNDNKPVFAQYPFTAEVPAYTQPGHEILHITAVDNDEGTNADIVFSFINEPAMNKFRINPNSGSVTAASSLAMESGKLFHLEVLATDKGNPPQSATGLIEIKVGESSENTQVLRFQNSTYVVHMAENSPVGKEVLQVSAVRSDGRRQRITYSLGSGNENGAFEITMSGVIRVRDSTSLDFEDTPQMKLVVVAQGEGSTGPPLYGYAQVLINLIDQNDNTPKFTQQQYSAVVWEGNNKGTFVMQVSATDMDQGANARLLYHIVDGNHDNAFVIEPPFSGLVKTNIVLDREIRDMYRLTVIATDEGMPQLTGTSTIRISIVDVNDNQPTFPPHSVISISEGKEVGSVITTVSANDVDTNPSLTYSLQEDPKLEGVFSIDRFSGKVILGKRLDFETRQEYRLKITASDTAHTAETVLTVKVTDDNDNAPVFSQTSYKTNLLDSMEMGSIVLTVNATDKDSGVNADIRYSLLSPVRGLSIDEHSGAIQVNRSAVVPTNPGDQVVDLIVVATDTGTPPLTATAALRLHINNAGNGNIFGHDEFRIMVNEKAEKGSSLLKMGNTGIREFMTNPQYTIIDGDPDNAFQMLSPQGELLLLKDLDRENKDLYMLKVTSNPLADNSSAIHIHVMVEDANDNAPKFVNLEPNVYVSEGVSIGHSIVQLIANDADLPPNSDLRYDIISGNDEDLFDVDLVSGIVTVKKHLDFDVGPSEYSLVVRATDLAKSPEIPLSTVETIKIILQDENDNTPHFPVSEYLEFVGENEAVGTPVFIARATDIDRGAYGQLNYSIVSAAASGFTDIEDSWKLFRVDPVSGLIVTNAVFDYESRNRYAFTLTTSDIGGRTARVRVRIEIESRDEFHPQFTERTYRFVLGGNDLPVGYVVGHVTATDRDKGPDGRIVYQLTSQNPYFKINRTTGVLMVKKKFDSGFDIKQDVSLVVTASSGRQGSLTNMSVVEISFDPLADTESNIIVTGSGNDAALAATSSGIADWAMGLLIALILIVLAFGAVFLFLHVRNRRHKKVNKPGLSGGQSTDTFVDPSAFDTIPIRGGVAGPASQFGPPKYDEIPTYRNNNTSSSNSGAATTSELSGSEQSGSSGRGSAEDGEDVEDEEIRMINEGPLQRESGLHRNPDDEDNLSDVSVHNTQEYLARLGIVDTQGTSSASRRHSESLVAGSSKDGLMHHQGVPIDGLHMFDEDAGGENDITNLIYAKLNDVSGSERGSSTEEVGGGSTGALGAAVDHVMVLGGFGDVPNGTHQPSMTGSLSSIVHSEEELTGSYNWDYLLDWGPQYQPLAHVFSEIARLKDDAASVKSGNSGASSGKSKTCAPPVVKTVPPPLLTSVAPRSIAAPVLSARNPHHSSVAPPQMLLLPRSPISHDASGGGFSTSTAMSPSFSPSLSPLATRSPSISPLVTPGVPTSHHVRQRTTDSELRI
ncbi:protein dachsous-like [Macrosteles quadrilineatus]|uniref:protein dachsous-like n=1 Tax=Macrosteles quadrilineatus TaxID=74068 RepID=UPI0023E3070B|nr:protein dachsous-like [Macrosteles quadrilineatus]